MESAADQIQDRFEAFQKVHSWEQAVEIGEILKRSGIEYHVIRDKPFFDISFAFNKTDPDVNLVIPSDKFLEAREVLQRFYESQVGSVDKDYYLFQFSDQELADIIQKPDEWGSFDYELAKHIMHQRGIDVTPDLESTIMSERLVALSKPEPVHPGIIIAGYLSAVLGGFIGIIFGWILSQFTKKLPNGERVFVYDSTVRKHGRIIFYLSVFIFVSFIVARLLGFTYG